MPSLYLRRLTSALTLASFNLLLFAALPPYTVERLPLHAQLPSENVRCVWQDADGYVWLGTEDGAVRYDGHRLSVVRNNATTLRILADNEVLSMAESRDFLLFGTARGLTVRDKRSGAFRTLRHADVRDAEVRTLATDAEGRVYVGTKKRLVRLSADLATVTRFPSLPVTSVNAVYASPAGDIVATFWDRGAYIYNKVSGAFDKFPTIGTRDCPFSVLADGRDALWLSSWTDGFFRAVRTGKRWRIDKVETPDALRVVYRMARQPKTGLIWTVGTGGPHVVRATAGRLAIEDDAAITSSMQKPFNSVFADRSGNVWVASQVGGVYMAYPDQRPWRCLTLPEMRQITGIDTDIRALTRDTGGRLWVAQTGGGVALLAGDGTPAWLNPSYRSHYIPLNDTRQLLASRHIKGEVWAATTYESALYRLAAEGGRPQIAERIDFNRLHGGTVRALCEDSHERLWIATERGVWMRGKDGKVSYARLAVPDVTAIVAIDSHQSPQSEATEAVTLYVASGTRGLIAATYKAPPSPPKGGMRASSDGIIPPLGGAWGGFGASLAAQPHAPDLGPALTAHCRSGGRHERALPLDSLARGRVHTP